MYNYILSKMTKHQKKKIVKNSSNIYIRFSFLDRFGFSGRFVFRPLGWPKNKNVLMKKVKRFETQRFPWTSRHGESLIPSLDLSLLRSSYDFTHQNQIRWFLQVRSSFLICLWCMCACMYIHIVGLKCD